MPKGTRFHCVAHFDNSSANRNNPDPTRHVFWGDQTWEEMMIGWIDYYYDCDNPLKPGFTHDRAHGAVLLATLCSRRTAPVVLQPERTVSVSYFSAADSE
jgi:hypothetical protein